MINDLLLLLCLIILLYYIISGIYQFRYKPDRSDNYIWGAYHVHSNFSDGLHPPSKIVPHAKKSRTSLVILTDHGGPNFFVSDYKKQVDNVQIIGGSETGSPHGHLNSFGMDFIPFFKFAPYPADALEDIRECGGFSVLAYPEDPTHLWKYWDPDFNPDGIEIINITTYFKKQNIWQIFKTIIYYPFSRYYFLKFYKKPDYPLRRWDELLARKKAFGFYAVNAHGKLPLTKKTGIPFPSYKNLFSIAGMGINKKYSDNPLKAVIKGDFFSLIRGAGEPELFEFYAVQKNKKLPGGSSLKGKVKLITKLSANNKKFKIILKKNGEKIKSTNSQTMEYNTEEEGVYRVEIYLLEHPLLKPDVPWIISNPVFLNTKQKAKESFLPKINKRLKIDLTKLKLDKDKKSSGSFSIKDKTAVFKYHLAKAEKKEVDRWCTLSLRKRINLSGYKGVYIKAWSDKYMRYWVKFRTDKATYFSSIKFYSEKEHQSYLDFNKFYKIDRKKTDIPLDKIQEFALSINSENSRTDFSSTLKIKEIGFYK